MGKLRYGLFLLALVGTLPKAQAAPPACLQLLQDVPRALKVLAPDQLLASLDVYKDTSTHSLAPNLEVKKWQRDTAGKALTTKSPKFNLLTDFNGKNGKWSWNLTVVPDTTYQFVFRVGADGKCRLDHLVASGDSVAVDRVRCQTLVQGPKPVSEAELWRQRGCSLVSSTLEPPPTAPRPSGGAGGGSRRSAGGPR